MPSLKVPTRKKSAAKIAHIVERFLDYVVEQQKRVASEIVGIRALKDARTKTRLTDRWLDAYTYSHQYTASGRLHEIQYYSRLYNRQIYKDVANRIKLIRANAAKWEALRASRTYDQDLDLAYRAVEYVRKAPRGCGFNAANEFNRYVNNA